MTTFSIQSFGCRVNQAEAFSWVNELQQNGLIYLADCMLSDFVIINSCTLTSRADRDVRSFVRKMKRENPEGKIFLTGCSTDYFQSSSPDQNEAFFVVPNNEKKNLVDSIFTIYPKGHQTSSYLYRSRALIKIQDGCDYKCSFCIIPSARGKSVSVPLSEVIEKVCQASEMGFTEAVLTGVHLCLYGRELNPPLSLLDLLTPIEQSKGPSRIRLSSLDPRFLKKEWIDFLVSSSKICPHFHLSLQNGSDAILKKMGRNIGTDKYQKILSSLHREIPGVSIGADIIVGFPGESDKDFEDTYSFLDSSPLTYFHVFSFSPRQGTPAADWKQVNDKIKKQRSALLRQLSQKKKIKFARSFIGKELEAVVIKKNNHYVNVVSNNGIEIKTPSCENEIKSLIKVRITSVSPNSIKGEMV